MAAIRRKSKQRAAGRKAVIFDFNRTIYDPDRRALFPRIRLVLRTLIRRGFDLYLVSTASPSRKAFIRELGVAGYFTRVIITADKSKAFEKIARSRRVSQADSFVVGDQVKREIAYGNRLAMRTIWLRAGKFADELPRSVAERPTHTIRKIAEATAIIT